MSVNKREIQKEGRAAFAADLSLKDNPYPDHTAAQHFWEQGHLLAFVENGMVMREI